MWKNICQHFWKLYVNIKNKKYFWLFNYRKVRVNMVQTIILLLVDKYVQTHRATPNPSCDATPKNKCQHFVQKYVSTLNKIYANIHVTPPRRSTRSIGCISCCQRASANRLVPMLHKHRLYWIKQVGTRYYATIHTRVFTPYRTEPSTVLGPKLPAAYSPEEPAAYSGNRSHAVQGEVNKIRTFLDSDCESVILIERILL